MFMIHVYEWSYGNIHEYVRRQSRMCIRNRIFALLTFYVAVRAFLILFVADRVFALLTFFVAVRAFLILFVAVRVFALLTFFFAVRALSLLHISELTRLGMISYSVFFL